MPRLIHDRYLAHDSGTAWDLATGRLVSPQEIAGASPIDEAPIAPLVDVLDHGRDGYPRWLVADLRRERDVATALARAATDAAARGYVPIAVDAFARGDDALADALGERTLLLIATPSTPVVSARSALVAAAARCPRPHVLLTLRAGRGPVAGRSAPPVRPVVREARAVYGVLPSSQPHAAHPSAEIARQLARASRAREFLQTGCHAAAERLLREVAAALHRRDAAEAEGHVLLALGPLLLERARVAHADRVFRDAADAADRVRAGGLAADARIGQASARIESQQLTSAESICRALLVAGTLTPHQRAATHATLARVLLSQARIDEAASLDLSLPPDALGDARSAVVDDTAVRVLIASGNLFAAGQRAREAVSRAAASPPEGLGHTVIVGGHPHLAEAIAQRAHLRVMAASGDLTLAEAAFAHAVMAARRARAPLQVARAYLLWADALARAGRAHDRMHVCRVLRRMRVAVPLRLRTAIDRRLREDADRPASAVFVVPSSDAARTFVQISHEHEDDREAVAGTLRWAAARLHASRIDVWSCDAGPGSTILSIGTGVGTTVGARVLEAGIAIGPDAPDGREIGVPVRLGATLVAAIAARWPADRAIPAHASPLLDLAAAVAAPRIDRAQSAAREVTQAAATVPELVGVSDAIAVVRKAVARAAVAPFSVLVEGESGVGKELVARAIHHLSPRRERRFCDLNCAALPDDLLDAELFGHARGAFTGAAADRAGLFEEADGGTLFLDELADLSPRAQAKLLRVLQEQEVRRIGETFGRKIDVRIVTAANRDLREEAAAGRFRQDLLYRLDVIRIRIPPLRERPADVAVLAAHFWQQAAARVGSSATLTHGVLSALSTYVWPGNVRELQNVISALAVAAPARGRVPASLLPPALAGAVAWPSATLADARTQFERRFIEAALARAGGRRSRAARDLGLSRQGLLKLMTRLGLAQKSLAQKIGTSG